MLGSLCEVYKYATSPYQRRMISVDNLLHGIDDAKHIRPSLYQQLQYTCRLLLANFKPQLYRDTVQRYCTGESAANYL